LLDTELQTAITELVEQEELLDSKNSTIADLANQVKGLTKQLQQKTSTLSQKITFIQQQQQQIANLTHDKQNLQN
jgi:prophage DNA circulation protein